MSLPQRSARAGRRRVPVAAVVAVAALVMSGCSGGKPTTVSQTAALAKPCGWRSDPPRVYDHVVWVIYENKSFEHLIGREGPARRKAAPHLLALADRCGLATRSYGITHPSLPNYLAAASGTTGGVRRDCDPEACPQHQASIFGQVRASGREWRVYAEGQPHNCALHNAGGKGGYAVRHTIAPYFPDVRTDCQRWDVPMGSLNDGALVRDVRSGSLPAFAVVAPNLCHQTHDCKIPQGDAWLGQLMDVLVGSATYRAGRTAVVLTYDEGSGGSSGMDCRTSADTSCHVATLVVSPTTPVHARSAQRVDHYSLLRSTEDMLGLAHLGHAGDASTTSLRRAFRL